jgi:DNA-binding Lrp family transcriptional regulator
MGVGLMMKLTENEKKTLKMLLKNARTSDAEIARHLNVTTQATRKIRQKLEAEKIIKRYAAILDYEKLGVKAFAIAMMKAMPDAIEKFGMDVIQKSSKDPCIVSFFRIPRGDVTHIALFGFRDLTELDNYFHIMQTKYARYIEIRRIYVFSNKSFLKQSATSLFEKIIDEFGKERFLPKPSFEGEKD